MLLRAVEEKRFLPVGADREVESDFQLLCGTNRDLRADVAAGRFREDLLARLDLWTFPLPGLAERREDLEPNLDYELEAFARRAGERSGELRQIAERLRRRDEQDALQSKPAEDAIFIDTGDLTLGQVVDAVLSRIQAVLPSGLESK